MTIAGDVPLGELYAAKTGSVNPQNHPDEVFDLFSVPSYELGKPDIVVGAEIGSSKINVEPGDVLICRIVPHIRRAWVVPPVDKNRQIASGEWIVLRDSRIHPQYLRQLLLSDVFHRQFMSTVAGVGGSLLRARPAQAASIPIPLPPLPEQRRIAEILDRADELRAKRRRALTLLDELDGAMFESSFITNSKNQSTSLGSVVKFSSGKFLPNKAMNTAGAVSVYGGNGVNGMHDEALYTEPQIIVGRVGAYCGVVHVTGERSWVTDNALIARWDPGIFGIHYLADALRRSNLNQFASQSGQPLISASRLAAVQIGMPTIASQEEYARKKVGVRALRSRHSAHLSNLNELFASLQHRAFNGEL